MGADSSQTASESGSDTITEGARVFQRLTGFQRDLLIAIAGLDEPSGQTITDLLDDRTGNEITHGRHYPNLRLRTVLARRSEPIYKTST